MIREYDIFLLNSKTEGIRLIDKKKRMEMFNFKIYLKIDKITKYAKLQNIQNYMMGPYALLDLTL